MNRIKIEKQSRLFSNEARGLVTLKGGRPTLFSDLTDKQQEKQQKNGAEKIRTDDGE